MVDKATVRLVETAKLEGEPYVTLSYCWGDCDHVKTLLSNYAELCNTIPVASLPQTLQDAISLARQLGRKYIWIDALCIIQDSDRDWQIESAMMSSVYRNADFCIAAATAAAASEGFMNHSRANDVQLPPLEVPWQTEDKRKSVLAARKVPRSISHAANDSHEYALPLSYRGWCLQERLLSTRTFTFAAQELHWSCLSTSRCECHALDRSWGPQSLSSGKPQSLETKSLFKIQKDEAWDKWKTIVGNYSYRELSEHSDKLPAIAGIAETIQDLTGSRYIAGLWEDDLVLGLAWDVGYIASVGRECPTHVPESYVAPTFSWASLTTGLSCSYGSRYRMAPLEWSPSCAVVRSNTVISGRNPLGRVSSGSILLRAWVGKCSLEAVADEYSDRLTWHTKYKYLHLPLYVDTRLEDFFDTNTDEDGKSHTWVRRSPFGSNKNVVTSGAIALLLYLGQWAGSYGGDHETQTRIFLVLGKSPGTQGAFERVGICLMDGHDEPGTTVEESGGFELMEITMV